MKNSKKTIKEKIKYLEGEQKKEYNPYRQINLLKLKKRLRE